MVKLLHVGNGNSRMPSTGPFYKALKEIGKLTIIKNGKNLSKKRIS